jgi:hypothetical protein
MPIINIQRRMAEQGRIRLGHKVGPKGYPGKLDKFRFTSPNQRLIADIAQLYGGEPQQWEGQWEVYSDARSIPVIVVKGGLSQWMETWSGGGCTHRCDGVTNVLTGDPCDPDDPAHRDAKPTTRLSVMLRDVETLGVWRLESHGWNAAAELPSIAELAMFVGDLVPATLHLVERKSISNGETKRFVVPVLDLAVSKARLVELVGGTAAAGQLQGAGPKQIEAPPEVYYAQAIADATTTDDLNTIWRRADLAGGLTPALRDAITARAREIHPPEAGEPSGGEVEGETVDDEAAAAVAWSAVVTEAGKHNWTTPMLTAAFEQWAAIPLADGDAVMFTDFLAALRRGDVAAPQVAS